MILRYCAVDWTAVCDCGKFWSYTLTFCIYYSGGFSPFQSGFRTDRSTPDNLVRLETFRRKGYLVQESHHMVYNGICILISPKLQ